MAANARPLSDGWEEVSDDNFSVISLPTSDDATDLDEACVAPESPANPASPLDVLPHKLASLTIRNNDTSSTLENVSDDVRSEAETKFEDVHTYMDKDVQYFDDAHYAKEAQGREDAEYTPSPYAPEYNEFKDILDVDIDPGWLHMVNTSLIKLITEILDAFTFHDNDNLSDGTRHVREECDVLRRHLRTLEPILKGYSKHWDPKRATVALPIDPGLYEWMSGLRIDLLGVEAALQSKMDQSSCNSKKAAPVEELARYHKPLEDFSSQIAGFIPIMQADFEDFHTANLPLFHASRETTTSPSTHQRHGLRGECASGLFHLKRGLYELKDQLSACLEEFQAYLDQEPPCDNKSSIEQLLGSYRIIKDSLSIILSNHASDWIEYGLAGGMTYPEFCRLNPDTISSLNLQLKDVVRNMSGERLNILNLRYTDLDSMLDSESLEIRTSDVDALRAIEEVMASILQVKK